MSAQEGQLVWMREALRPVGNVMPYFLEPSRNKGKSHDAYWVPRRVVHNENERSNKVALELWAKQTSNWEDYVREITQEQFADETLVRTETQMRKWVQDRVTQMVRDAVYATTSDEVGCKPLKGKAEGLLKALTFESDYTPYIVASSEKEWVSEPLLENPSNAKVWIRTDGKQAIELPLVAHLPDISSSMHSVWRIWRPSNQPPPQSSRIVVIPCTAPMDLNPLITLFMQPFEQANIELQKHNEHAPRPWKQGELVWMNIKALENAKRDELWKVLNEVRPLINITQAVQQHPRTWISLHVTRSGMKLQVAPHGADGAIIKHKSFPFDPSDILPIWSQSVRMTNRNILNRLLATTNQLREQVRQEIKGIARLYLNECNPLYYSRGHEHDLVKGRVMLPNEKFTPHLIVARSSQAAHTRGKATRLYDVENRETIYNMQGPLIHNDTYEVWQRLVREHSATSPLEVSDVTGVAWFYACPPKTSFSTIQSQVETDLMKYIFDDVLARASSAPRSVPTTNDASTALIAGGGRRQATGLFWIVQ